MAVGSTTRRRDQHDNAVSRLAGARQEQARLSHLHAAAVGTRGETPARERLSAAHAVVVSREEWLHWVDEGESIAPWADGEWSPHGSDRFLPSDPLAAGARDIERVFLARPIAVGEARRLLVQLELQEAMHDKVELLISELMTNAVRQPGNGTVAVHVTNQRERVRLEVHDSGAGFDPAAVAPTDPGTPGGNGLVIVAALSDAWGVDTRRDGCTVWCEVTSEAEQPSTGALDGEITSSYVNELAAQVPRPS
jgi:serine/threonine-protein kinase RsbW